MNEVPFIQEVQAYTLLHFKMALQARKGSEAFEKRAPSEKLNERYNGSACAFLSSPKHFLKYLLRPLTPSSLNRHTDIIAYVGNVNIYENIVIFVMSLCSCCSVANNMLYVIMPHPLSMFTLQT